MRKPRIGIIGLGGIAQKAYLPILSQETDWEVAGAFTPNVQKRNLICSEYRMEEYASVKKLAADCDAVFVHSSTTSHYAVVAELLRDGKDVYVDNPLAATVTEAEELVEVSKKHGRKLMVGFNRRFAPQYIKAKQKIPHASAVRFEKHHVNGIGADYKLTMLDDYLHLIDTVRWLTEGKKIQLVYPRLQLNEADQLIYAQHTFETDDKIVYQTGMHRQAGTNLEQLEVVALDSITRVKNMRTVETEKDGILHWEEQGTWETMLTTRGFTGAVTHFIDCLQQDMQPMIDGEQALQSQRVLESLLEE
ncbi:putative oxidoreductase YceM [Lentibacillus sp. JNUCC-1]|uniref:Gfo/Idh/MocA family protein n=1 Tax=Lentibacillus sp. JNUCC-1 TaxID=2654513 RepID=UPI0012E8A56B|nr:Gfo/Idh/MocA family oxidoreductase [Lentibacillus sp. JNUCC-1]MUV37118.1 putative oxidoreductase YceM [Lentibacillus sp. JNUCC-1]